MPAPQASQMQQLARLQFASFGIKLPMDWKQPQKKPDKDHYPKAFKLTERLSVEMPCPPALFKAASLNKYHTDTAKKCSDQFGEYIDGICSAICSAWSNWQTAATMVGVVINAVSAVGGQVVGPPLGPLILASAPKSTPMMMKYSNAIANTIGTGWLSYTATIKVPGMPWYPAFAAVPSPVAPPAPNVPASLIMLTQVPVSISKDVLKGQMIAMLGDPKAPHHKELFDCIAHAFDKCFKIWQASTMVTQVMGTGPVPTFAPPFVPVGPVLGGVGTMPPGGFK